MRKREKIRILKATAKAFSKPLSEPIVGGILNYTDLGLCFYAEYAHDIKGKKEFREVYGTGPSHKCGQGYWWARRNDNTNTQKPNTPRVNYCLKRIKELGG